jgi:hypothetical protein
MLSKQYLCLICKVNYTGRIEINVTILFSLIIFLATILEALGLI